MFQGSHFMLETAMGYPILSFGTFWDFLKTDHHTHHLRSTFRTRVADKYYKRWDTLQFRFQDQAIFKIYR